MSSISHTPYQFGYSVNTRGPILFALLSFIFIYALQYPIGIFFFDAAPVENTVEEWLIAYAFVIYSTLVTLAFISLGMRGKQVVVEPPPVFFSDTSKRLPFMMILAVILFFFAWSYLMRELKIGMTIYADFEELPFKMVGILYYGRLLIQPLILAYIAHRDERSGWTRKMLIFSLFFALGAWAALTSGSRFTAIMFSLPYLLLFRGAKRIIVFALVAGIFITIASLSRNFYLPFFISDEYIFIYASTEYQENMLSNVPLLAVGYLVQRAMGIAEVLLTFDYGSIAPTFTDSFLALVTFFIPLTIDFSAASTKNIYGFSDDIFGGFGLGMFPNYWVVLGGDVVTYSIGLAFSAFLLGRCHRLLSIALKRFGFPEGIPLVFIILFVLFFEARSFVFPSVLCIAWLIARPATANFVKRLVERPEPRT